MIEFTPEEQEIIARSAKAQVDLPTYYDSALKQNVQITREFEAFLILAPTDLKTSAIEWINQVTQLAKVNKVRDQLRTLMVQKQIDNATKKLEAYGETFGEFNEFRKTFQTQTRFAAVPEVIKFINDLQSAVDEQNLGQQRAFFEQTLALIFQSNQELLNLTQDDIEELQSWRQVLSAYLQG